MALGHFWTSDRILLALIFAIGLVVGGIITHNYLEPTVFSQKGNDYNSLLELNARLDERNDLLRSCLTANNITVESCAQ